MVRLEKLYDLRDKFNKVTNCKTNKSAVQFEAINFGSEKIPKTRNLGKKGSTEERQEFIKLFEEYKDIILDIWWYQDIQHKDNSICYPYETTYQAFSIEVQENVSELAARGKGWA